MAERLDYVTPGEPFRPSAATWNSFVDAARTVRGQRVIFGVPPLQPDVTDDPCAIGRATTAITAASSNLTGAAFMFVRFVPDSSIYPQTTPLTLKEEVDSDDAIVETDGVNRSTKITANVDAFVKLIRVNGEWELIFAEDVCPE